jgi:hypothetical protein
VSGRPNPPASSAAVNPRVSSANASGFPRVSATILSPHALVQPPGHYRLQQRAGVSVAQPRDRELRKSRQVLVPAGFSLREDHGDRFRQEAARDERECLCGSPVEPLRVVNQADQRLFLSHLGEQSERREADGIAIWRRPGAQAECRAQRVALRVRQARQAGQQGRAQLVQDGERQFHLGLNTRRPHDATVRCALLRVVQQDGLADSRLTAQDQHPAVTCAHIVQQAVQNRLLTIPATQCLGHDIRAIPVVFVWTYRIKPGPAGP